MQEQAATSSLPSSSERSSSSALHLEVKEGMESDDEIRRVPEIDGEAAGRSASGRSSGVVASQVSGEGQRKRGSAADKENKRLKRLLRNRVSAQQARERKKAYLNELEVRVKDLEKNNSELVEKLSTLQNENQMLRHCSNGHWNKEDYTPLCVSIGHGKEGLASMEEHKKREKQGYSTVMQKGRLSFHGGAQKEERFSQSNAPCISEWPRRYCYSTARMHACDWIYIYCAPP